MSTFISLHYLTLANFRTESAGCVISAQRRSHAIINFSQPPQPTHPYAFQSPHPSQQSPHPSQQSPHPSQQSPHPSQQSSPAPSFTLAKNCMSMHQSSPLTVPHQKRPKGIPQNTMCKHRPHTRRAPYRTYRLPPYRGTIALERQEQEYPAQLDPTAHTRTHISLCIHTHGRQDGTEDWEGRLTETPRSSPTRPSRNQAQPHTHAPTTANHPHSRPA